MHLVARRGALRADEAAPAERQPPGDGLNRLPGGLPVRARGSGRPGLHRVPCGATCGRKAGQHYSSGTNLDEYIHTLLQRFANPAIRDTLARLAAFGSDRIPKWLVPMIQQNLASGGEVTRSAAVVASWARYAEGIEESGRPIVVVDGLRSGWPVRGGRRRTRWRSCATSSCSVTSPGSPRRPRLPAGPGVLPRARGAAHHRADQPEPAPDLEVRAR